MSRHVPYLVAASLALAASPPAQDTDESLAKICARSGGIARLGEIGKSLGGQPIDLVTLAADSPRVESERPGILILAGADGDHEIGRALATAQVRYLVDDYAAGVAATRNLLADAVLYVIPNLSPDGPALGRSGNSRALDLDRDGRFDEDRPRDLDGDGFVSRMRWPDPDGEWLPDPEEPRVMRKADRKKGERGTHRLEVEGADTDGDGARAEDGGDGIAIFRNFAQRHAEFDRTAGPFPMSEPESRALADFVITHRNIVMAFVWDRDDNLLATPKANEAASRVLYDGVHRGDVDRFAEIGKLYRERTGRSGDSRPRMDGSPWSWLYLHLGIPTFASDVWRTPTTWKTDAGEFTGDRAKLALCEREQRGFVAWHAFRHPELGDVEIGGFLTGGDSALCSTAERSTVFAAHHGFFLEVVAYRSSLRIRDVRTETPSPGVQRVSAVVVNDGKWPWQWEMTKLTRRFGSSRVDLVFQGDLIAGQRRTEIRALDALGDHEKIEWLIAPKPETRLTVELRCDPVGTDSKEIR
ncbi:MAG: M14 family zinc carboxypeptidase [Planctomycetota bacterium]